MPPGLYLSRIDNSPFIHAFLHASTRNPRNRNFAILVAISSKDRMAFNGFLSKKRLDEIIDQESNQLRIKFVVNNWNNILDICENIQTCFKLALRKNRKKLSFHMEYLIFLLLLFIYNDKLSTFYQEKVGFERNEENFIRRRKNDCVISTRFGGCRRKGWARRKR